MKRATVTHHVSGNCCQGFQGQRSKVKVICVQMRECYSGGDMHFDGMASKHTCRCLSWLIVSSTYVANASAGSLELSTQRSRNTVIGK